jgi:hypothetical protein
MGSYTEKRVSFTFYAEDLKALRRLNLALRDSGADVHRLDTLRLLMFAASEAELFSHAALFYKEKGKGRRAKETVVERLSVTVPSDFITKLSTVADDLARKDLDVERTYIVRALLHAAHDPASLVKAWSEMEERYPDKRTLRGQRRERAKAR